jgi:hypothetical protein
MKGSQSIVVFEKRKISEHYGSKQDNFQGSIMIGYGNTGSYIPKIFQKMLATSSHLIFSLF